MPEDLQVTARRDRDVGLLVVGGEVRLEIATRLRKAGHDLLVRGARHLLVNLKGVVFMDSASLAALIRLDQEVEQKGGHFVLFSISPAVERVLTNSGLQDRFVVAPTEDDARGRLSS